MNIPVNQLKLGYTLGWKKTTKKDIECGKGITLLSNDNNLAFLVQTMENYLDKIRSQKGNEKASILSLSRTVEVELHDIRAIANPHKSQSSTTVSRFFLNMLFYLTKPFLVKRKAVGFSKGNSRLAGCFLWAAVEKWRSSQGDRSCRFIQ